MKSLSIVTMTALAFLLAAGVMVSQQTPQQQTSPLDPPQPPKRVMPGTPDPDKANSATPNKTTPQPFTPPAKTSEDDGPVIRSTVQVVLVPTLVTNKKGLTISGLRVNDFTLFDNDKPQKIDRDVRSEERRI